MRSAHLKQVPDKALVAFLFQLQQAQLMAHSPVIRPAATTNDEQKNLLKFSPSSGALMTLFQAPQLCLKYAEGRKAMCHAVSTVVFWETSHL